MPRWRTVSTIAVMKSARGRPIAAEMFTDAVVQCTEPWSDRDAAGRSRSEDQYVGQQFDEPEYIRPHHAGDRAVRAGAGMVHTVCWRVPSPDALTFWEERLRAEGILAPRIAIEEAKPPPPRPTSTAMPKATAVLRAT